MRAFRSLPTLALLVALALTQRVSGEDAMYLSGAAAAPGERDVPARVSFTNDLAMQGYSISIAYDAEVLSCTSVGEIGGLNPEYFHYLIDEEAGSVVIGAILALQPSSPALIIPSPTEPVDMVELTFDVSEIAMPGLAELELVDGLGSPPVENVFSIDGQDLRLDNLLSDGIEIANPNRYFFRDINAWAGFPFTAILAVDHPFDLQGLQIEVAFDSSLISIDSLSTAGTELVLEANSGESNIEFLEIDYSNSEGYAEVAMIFDLLAPLLEDKVLPPGEQNIVELRFEQDSSVVFGDETTLEFTNDGLVNLVTYHGGLIGVTPQLDNYSISFSEPPDGLLFKRGAMNSDGLTNMADAIFLLQYIFMGGAEPSCMKAADFTDNGSVDIADGIRLLTWLFANGTPPPAPYPDCGIDPTPDALTCATATAGC